MQKIAKAIAGAIAGGVTAPGLMLVAFPEDVTVPWWGYLIAATLNGGITAFAVYFAPKNQESLPALLFAVTALPLLMALSACGTVSDSVNAWTGTTIEQRCATIGDS